MLYAGANLHLPCSVKGNKKMTAFLVVIYNYEHSTYSFQYSPSPFMREYESNTTEQRRFSLENGFCCK